MILVSASSPALFLAPLLAAAPGPSLAIMCGLVVASCFLVGLAVIAFMWLDLMRDGSDGPEGGNGSGAHG